MTVSDRLRELADLAAAWQDPDYDSREASVRVMLEGEARFTEEGLAFTLNHHMYQLSELLPEVSGLLPDALPVARTVGITPAARDPLGGLAESVAALVLGHRVVLESPTPLMTAFLDEAADRIDGDVQSVSREGLLDVADGWIVRYDAEEAGDMEKAVADVRLSASRVDALLLGDTAVVLDGREDQETLSGLAEDLLLHEGLAPGTPRVVWAPAGTPPDALLNALAGFRELYPAHPGTDGTLVVSTAFLVAAKRPHATGPGFLISLGEPEPQAPAHIRWVEYEDLGEIEQWARSREAPLMAIVAAPTVARLLDVPVPCIDPGDVHRRGLFDRELFPFLRSL